MGFYDDMADVAAEVLAEFKQGVVQLSRTTYAAPDPATPWEPGAPTTITHELDATVSGVSQEYIDGTLILATDLQVVCAVPPVMPDMATDTLTIDGKVQTVLKNQQLPAAGTPVAYLFVVRG